jgi:hypothetical protein
VKVTGTIDYALSDEKDDGGEMIVENWGGEVRIQIEPLFEGSIYIDRDRLVALLLALDVSSGAED